VTYVYTFDSDGATALAMIVNTSLAGAGRIPGFNPEGRYELKIHLDGTVAEQLTYRFSFAPADASGAQQVAIDRLAGPDTGDDHAAGTPHRRRTHRRRHRGRRRRTAGHLLLGGATSSRSLV
jgi:hypothetical protein